MISRPDEFLMPMPDSKLDDAITSLVESLGTRSIVLVGLMGAGKTTIGRRLADQLGLDFADADAEIENAAGMSITELFEAHGEAYFRTGETKVIQRLLEDGPKVLATGGGAYMNPETRAHIKNAGISVWLEADLDLLWKRVQGRRHRPLLLAKNPKQILAALIDERYPVYRQADITITTADVPHSRIVKDVISALLAHLH